MGLLVSIFAVGINSKSSPWPVHTLYKKPPQIFCDVRCWLTTRQITLTSLSRRQPITIDYWVTWITVCHHKISCQEFQTTFTGLIYGTQQNIGHACSVVGDTVALNSHDSTQIVGLVSGDLRLMSHLQFYLCRATLSRDKIASVTCRVAHCNFVA